MIKIIRLAPVETFRRTKRLRRTPHPPHLRKVRNEEEYFSKRPKAHYPGAHTNVWVDLLERDQRILLVMVMFVYTGYLVLWAWAIGLQIFLRSSKRCQSSTNSG